MHDRNKQWHNGPKKKKEGRSDRSDRRESGTVPSRFTHEFEPTSCGDVELSIYTDMRMNGQTNRTRFLYNSTCTVCIEFLCPCRGHCRVYALINRWFSEFTMTHVFSAPQRRQPGLLICVVVAVLLARVCAEDAVDRDSGSCNLQQPTRCEMMVFFFPARFFT